MPEGGVRWNNSPAVLPPHTGPSGALLTPSPAALLGFLRMGGRGGELPAELSRACYQGAGPQRPVCGASPESHTSGWPGLGVSPMAQQMDANPGTWGEHVAPSPRESTSGHACPGISSAPCMSTMGRGSSRNPRPCSLILKLQGPD